MLSMRSVMKAEVNGKEYCFSCSPDSPLADALEAVSQVQAFLIGKQEQGKQAAEKAAQEAVKPDEVIV